MNALLLTMRLVQAPSILQDGVLFQGDISVTQLPSPLKELMQLAFTPLECIHSPPQYRSHSQHRIDASLRQIVIVEWRPEIEVSAAEGAERRRVRKCPGSKLHAGFTYSVRRPHN